MIYVFVYQFNEKNTFWSFVFEKYVTTFEPEYKNKKLRNEISNFCI